MADLHKEEGYNQGYLEDVKSFT